MEMGEYFFTRCISIIVVMKFLTRNIGFFPNKGLWVGPGSWLGMRSGIVFWAVLFFSLLVILETHVGLPTSPISYFILDNTVQNCGNGDSPVLCLEHLSNSHRQNSEQGYIDLFYTRIIRKLLFGGNTRSKLFSSFRGFPFFFLLFRIFRIFRIFACLAFFIAFYLLFLSCDVLDLRSTYILQYRDRSITHSLQI